MNINVQVSRKQGPGANTVTLGRRVEAGLWAMGLALLEEANRLVPRDTEAMADSGRVSKEGSGLNTVVVVGYGGKDFPPRTEFSIKENRVVTRIPSEYTVYVHEMAEHAHDSPEQYKFLETPLKEKHDVLRMAFNSEMG